MSLSLQEAPEGQEKEGDGAADERQPAEHSHRPRYLRLNR